jgi:hypothetical protein
MENLNKRAKTLRLEIVKLQERVIGSDNDKLDILFDSQINLILQAFSDVASPYIEMLKQARCPNGNCDNAGTLTEAIMGKNGWPEPYPAECQWCWERDKLITNKQDKE